MFDAHCHLQFPAFDPDRAQALERARAAGVTSFCSCAVGPDDWDATLDLASMAAPRRGLALGIGIHPMAIQRWDAREDAGHLERLDKAIATARARIAALGECGLDARLAERAPLSRQLAVLEGQLALALRHRLPIVLHCVHAQEALLDLLQNFPDARGLVHAFSGSREQARALLRWDLFFSFGGALTLPSRKRRALVRWLPEDRILAETDAPDGPLIRSGASSPAIISAAGKTSPISRQRRLEPAALTAVVAAIAAQRGESSSFWARRTAENAQALFFGVDGCPPPFPT